MKTNPAFIVVALNDTWNNMFLTSQTTENYNKPQK